MPETQVSVTGVGFRRLRRGLRWRLQRARAGVAVRLAPDFFVPQLAAARIPIDAEVVVYFAETPRLVYQIDQWLPVLERLARKHKVVLILRRLRTLRELQDRTTLPVVCVTSFLDLMNVYDAGEFKVGIYVNNAHRNFQSLNNPRMLHVHVNHGESDKLSSFSNQVKGYDKVFVAGPVAVRRYREGLILFDESKLVPVGRPQLDISFPPEIPSSTRRTVMYAPTWEGASESNNWTSLDCYGVQIVKALLAMPDVRLVYKPHPRVVDSNRTGVSGAHERIVALIRESNRRDPQAGHLVKMEGNVLAMFARCDALVGDISSVTIDFLYLRPDAPIFLTDRRNDRELLASDSPLSMGASVVDAGTIDTFGAQMAEELATDGRRDDRQQARNDYFGDLMPGDSMQRFEDAVSALIAERDRLLQGHKRVSTGDVDVHAAADTDDDAELEPAQ